MTPPQVILLSSPAPAPAQAHPLPPPSPQPCSHYHLHHYHHYSFCCTRFPCLNADVTCALSILAVVLPFTFLFATPLCPGRLSCAHVRIRCSCSQSWCPFSPSALHHFTRRGHAALHGERCTEGKGDGNLSESFAWAGGEECPVTGVHGHSLTRCGFPPCRRGVVPRCATHPPRRAGGRRCIRRHPAGGAPGPLSFPLAFSSLSSHFRS